ncbi:MAG: Hsp33 family molecular chaperone [Hyphomicrobiaceae bacterium]|nr:MAG: Hsp33 family molecular chaperone [Hyphomicrobiaceae bacterium]
MAEPGVRTSFTRPGAGDDLVIPFRTERSGVIGRIVRLGSAADQILTKHAYPEPVSKALGEALAITAMLGVALKPNGRLILQTKSKGALELLVVNYEQTGAMRAYAQYDGKLVASYGRNISQGRLLGEGHLALTIDPGHGSEQQQGIVALNSVSLADAALGYFHQSEQLPTLLRVAVARHYAVGSDGRPGQQTWRAGGLMIQHTAATELRALEEGESHDDRLAGEADENWNRARLLAETVEDHELLDPTLSSEELLLRLFHEEGVRVFKSNAIRSQCRCSRPRTEGLLRILTDDDIAHLSLPDGSVQVRCEFCNTSYGFTKPQIEAARRG